MREKVWMSNILGHTAFCSEKCFWERHAVVKCREVDGLLSLTYCNSGTTHTLHILSWYYDLSHNKSNNNNNKTQFKSVLSKQFQNIKMET